MLIATNLIHQLASLNIYYYIHNNLRSRVLKNVSMLFGPI